MGCGTSSDSGNTAIESPATVENHTDIAMKGQRTNETLLEAYQRLDEEICVLEGLCPGPRLATAESWISFLESQIQSNGSDTIQMPLHMIEEMDNTEDPYTIKLDREAILEKDKLSINKVRQLAEKLNVAFDIERASKYEEFLASVSRNFMSDVGKYLKQEMLEHAKKRANDLLQQYTKLRLLYSEQDGLLASVTDGTYTSVSEQRLDDDLESARQIRDKMGGVAEQWRTAANLLRASAKGAILSAENWSLIGSSRNAEERISLATECRSSIQGSITALRGAQQALPQVEIQHITQRQISAVAHANEYLLTDMANDDRYQHTKRVFDAFQNSLSLAVKWLHDTFKKTLKKDLDDAEDIVLGLAKQLRKFRVEYIQVLVGNKLYLPAAETA